MSTDLIFGTRPVLEALKSGKPIEKIFIQKTKKGNIRKNKIKIVKRG